MPVQVNRAQEATGGGAEASPRRHPLWRQTVLALALRGIGVILAFASQVVVARALGVVGFGSYVTILAWTTLLSLLAGAGLPQAGIRFLAAYAEARDWASYRGFVRMAARAVAASGIAVGLAAVTLFATVASLRPLLAAMATGMLLIVLFSASTLAQAALVAAQRAVRGELTNNVVRALLVMALVAGAAQLSPALGVIPALDVEFVLGLTVLAGLLTLLVQSGAWWQATGLHWRGTSDIGARPAWLASGRAYLIATAAYALVERLDTILLAVLAPPAEVGPYSVAARLALLVSVALGPISAIATASAAQLLARGDRAGLQRLMAQTALIGSGAGAALALALLVATPWLLAVFGAGFETERAMVAVLLLGQVALAVAGPAGGLLAVAGRNRALIGIMLATVVLDLVLCLLLVPPFASAGAAVATMLALIFNAVALAVAARLLLGIDTTLLAGVTLVVRHVLARR